MIINVKDEVIVTISGQDAFPAIVMSIWPGNIHPYYCAYINMENTLSFVSCKLSEIKLWERVK